MRKNIVGIGIAIERIGDKFEMSQETGVGDRNGVVDGFANLGTETGSSVAQMIDARGKPKATRSKARSSGPTQYPAFGAGSSLARHESARIASTQD